MKTYVLLFCLLVATTVKGQSMTSTFYDEDSGLSQWHVTQMLQDQHGMMWFATWNGLNRFDGKEFVSFKAKAGDGVNMPTDRFRDMILAKNNDIYCRVDETWYRFSQQDGKFHTLSQRANQKLHTIIHRQTKYLAGKDNIYFEMHDRQQNRWRIMTNGILKETPLHAAIHQVPSLGKSSQIRAFLKDRQHRIWISSRENKSLYLFDQHLRFIRSIPVQASVYSITEDAQGRILLGCKPEGLLIGDKHGFRTRSPKLDVYDVLPSSTSDSHQTSPLGTSAITLATFQGIYTVQKQDQKAESYTCLPFADTQKLRFRKLYREGDALVAACTEGLLVANMKTGKYILHRKDPHRANSLSSSACMNILKHEGKLYIATESGGVNELLNTNLLDRELRFRHFDMTTGLPSDIALSMVSLGHQILIVSSNQLIILDPKTGKSRTLGKHFLQRSCQFSDAMPIRLEDGRWLFGLQDGAITIDEKAMQNQGYRPYLALTGLTIENQPTQRQVDALREISLGTQERTLSLSFAALDYSDPDQILYAYRLADDADWHYLGHTRSISLPELKPGDYELLIQSTNADGTWCGNARKLKIHVTPKFTETIWFDILVLLFILSVIGAIAYTYIYIRRMKQQQHETLEAYLALLSSGSTGSIEGSTETGSTGTGTADPHLEAGVNGPTVPVPNDPIDSKPKLSEQDDAMMQRIMAYVEAHLDDADAGVSEMAEAALMSKSSLTRKLKELVGLTPGDFLKEARIKRASEMLKTSTKNISEVAYACGFNDPKYFSKVFKASTGKSPSEYRE